MKSTLIQADKSKKLILSAVLIALALILSLVDASLSSMLPIVPGAKLGLANLVTLFAIYALGLPYALMITIVRGLLTALMSGNIMMLLFSLGGGITAVFIMYALKNVLNIIKVSVCAGIAHNLIQLAAAVFVTDTPNLIYYAPILICAGAICGFATGAIVTVILRRLKDYTLTKNEKRSY